MEMSLSFLQFLRRRINYIKFSEQNWADGFINHDSASDADDGFHPTASQFSNVRLLLRNGLSLLLGAKRESEDGNPIFQS